MNDPFKKWAENLKIRLISTSVYHPQGKGAVERANKSLLRGITTRLEKGGSAWAEEVPNVLWAHQTMKKTSNGETPFILTYGTKAVIPAEIGMPTHITSGVNERTNDQELRLNLDLLDEQREITSIREARYKQQVEKYYNKKDPPGKDPTKLSKHSKAEHISQGTGMLVTSEGARCKTPGMTIQQRMARYLRANKQKGGEQTLLPFAHNKYSSVNSYIGWRKRHKNINLNVASKCIRSQAVPSNPETAKVGLPRALAHGLQPESCCGKTGPCWLNRPDPYKSRRLSDK
ncbi:reverse transcriptase domain-containing protein [Tanacetum coccineum]